MDARRPGDKREPLAPTIEDARRAAEVLVGEGVAQVWLYGSVSRGCATPVSDIDLVSVLDDLDYSQRQDIEKRLSLKASEFTGYEVHVYLTDRPEWQHRVGHVSSSFEAGIADDLILLADRPAKGDVNWDKELELPTDNESEAASRVVDMNQSLLNLSGLLTPNQSEMRASASGSTELLLERQKVRMWSVCAAAALTIECSLKALLAAAGKRVSLAYNRARPSHRTLDALVAEAKQSAEVAHDAALAIGSLATATTLEYAGDVQTSLNNYDILSGEPTA